MLVALATSRLKYGTTFGIFGLISLVPNNSPVIIDLAQMVVEMAVEM